MSKSFKPAQPFNSGPRPQIALIAVESAQIAAIGYSPEMQTLAVTFTRGAAAVYHYPNQAPLIYEGFMAAESKGKFFEQHIRPMPFEKYHADEVAPA